MIRRLAPQSGEVIDRSAPLKFAWNSKKLVGYRGDTIVSALLANNERIISRSMKYHRPRGVLTADYWDPNATVQVGTEPNVRGAHRLLEANMKVSAQSAWPSLHFDIKAANSLFGRFLTAGFYYKTFIKPQRLWPAYEKVLARFAPGGVVDLDTPHGYHDKRYAHPDVVVAGAGPAGLAAAISAAQAGMDVMLVEHNHHLGGHLRWGSDQDRAIADELEASARKAGVEILTDSTVTGRYDDNWVAISQRSHQGVVERLIKARAKTLVVAPGLIERPYVFAGNDLVGVMLSGAVRRLINMYAVRPGHRAVVLTANAQGDAAIADLEGAGVEIAAVVDARVGETISSASGTSKTLGTSKRLSKRLKSVTLGDGSVVRADLLVTSVGWTAPTSLLNMAGDRPSYSAKAARFFPTALPDNVIATGQITGDGNLDELIAHGTASGELAAERAAVVKNRLRRTVARAVTPSDAEPEMPNDRRVALGREFHPEMYRSDTHGMVDYSEDVSSKDLVSAAAEGFDSVELVKRFTTATMGPSQGKLETVNTVAVLAQARGETIEEVGTTVWRPPYAPISLGALAGRVFEPVRVSSIHDWHSAHNMTPILAGRWIRPEHYGDPQAEVVNVRTNVGITDVTPLGKLDLRGPDVAKLLNLVYTNKWSNLPVGRVRYGLMCAEDGVVFDDGVTGRLGEDHYLMSTTSSGAAQVWQWIEMWLQTEHPDWQVHVTPVTTGYTSINIAGPNSRELLDRLVGDVDLSGEAFGYMNVRSGTIAGVANCVIWRIGFTGELSYEVHVPAGFGAHVWERLLAVGADLGVAPFGLEAQRIMRLEKGHFIVGQDTDGLTKALTTGLTPLIKLDKADFAGKPELAWSLSGGANADANADAVAGADTGAAVDTDVGAGKPELPVLVAITPLDPQLVPDESCQILREGTTEIVGRITSSRFSPTLQRSICLGQVTPEFAGAGTELTVRLCDGSDTKATVMAHHAHFDPEGVRLRG